MTMLGFVRIGLVCLDCAPPPKGVTKGLFFVFLSFVSLCPHHDSVKKAYTAQCIKNKMSWVVASRYEVLHRIGGGYVWLLTFFFLHENLFQVVWGYLLRKGP